MKPHPVLSGIHLDTEGNVFRITGTARFALSQRVSKRGYKVFGIKKRTYNTHVAMLETYVSLRPTGLVGAHLDGNPLNNRVENLRWVTPVENCRHRAVHGTHLRGSRITNSKLNEVDVMEMVYLWQQGVTAREIGEHLGVARDTVKEIMKGRGWAWLTGGKVLRKRSTG